MENEQIELTEAQKLSIQVHNEFEKMEAKNKAVFNTVELQNSAPTIYDIIFDTYEEGKSNGVETDNFSLIEDTTNLETFNFIKK